jgi:hypothetical protein
VETDQGANQTFSFDVTRSGTGYSGAATLRWRVEAVGANPTNTADFTSTDTLGNNGGLPSGTVSFANGVLTANFNVLVKGDLIAENNETFRVVIYEDVLTGASPHHQHPEPRHQHPHRAHRRHRHQHRRLVHRRERRQPDHELHGHPQRRPVGRLVHDLDPVQRHDRRQRLQRRHHRHRELCRRREQQDHQRHRGRRHQP